MFRQATENDIERIAEIYAHIHDAEEIGAAVVGWARQVYPTRRTAQESVRAGDMFVEEDRGIIVASGRINQIQPEEYKNCPWYHVAADNDIMVLHTLAVDPMLAGNGYGTAFVEFYETYALSKGCPYLRIDTQEKNAVARAFYQKHGFRESGTVLCTFNGIPKVHLICLEKKL